MKCARVLLLSGLIGGVGACAPVETLVRHDETAQPAAVLDGEGVLAVAPPVILSDVPGAVEEDAFAEQMIVGHVHLSGGYIELETDRGIQYRSKNVELGAEEGMRAQVKRWLGEVIREIVTERVDGRARFLERFDPAALPAPRRRYARGSGPLDMRDNQNLPRYALEAVPLTEKARAALPPLDGARWLLVPVVVYYYSHNGGWFIGQTLGTGGGARGRIFWVVYDLESGRPVDSGEVEARRVEKYVFSPNSAQIEDYLISIEEALARELAAHLLR